MRTALSFITRYVLHLLPKSAGVRAEQLLGQRDDGIAIVATTFSCDSNWLYSDTVCEAKTAYARLVYEGLSILRHVHSMQFRRHMVQGVPSSIHMNRENNVANLPLPSEL